jgi:hypothetical protein
MDNRRIELPLYSESFAEVIMCFWQVGSQLYSGLKGAKRCVEMPFLGQGKTEVVV